MCLSTHCHWQILLFICIADSHSHTGTASETFYLSTSYESLLMHCHGHLDISTIYMFHIYSHRPAGTEMEQYMYLFIFASHVWLLTHCHRQILYIRVSYIPIASLTLTVELSTCIYIYIYIYIIPLRYLCRRTATDRLYYICVLQIFVSTLTVKLNMYIKIYTSYVILLMHCHRQLKITIYMCLAYSHCHTDIDSGTLYINIYIYTHIHLLCITVDALPPTVGYYICVSHWFLLPHWHWQWNATSINTYVVLCTTCFYQPTATDT